jgi:hypothetical protein
LTEVLRVLVCIIRANGQSPGNQFHRKDS